MLHWTLTFVENIISNTTQEANQTTELWEVTTPEITTEAFVTTMPPSTCVRTRPKPTATTPLGAALTGQPLQIGRTFITFCACRVASTSPAPAAARGLRVVRSAMSVAFFTDSFDRSRVLADLSCS